MKNQDFVKVKDIVDISKIDKRTIHRRLQKGKYQYRIINGNGGKQYEILVSSLEEDIQIKLQHVKFNVEENVSQANNFPVLFNQTFNGNEVELLKQFNLDNNATVTTVIPEKAKNKALLKVDLINLWLEFRQNSSLKKSVSDLRFEELFNSGLIGENIHKTLGSISIKSIYRWHKAYTQAGNNYEVLADGYNYGSDNTIKTSLLPIEKYLLLKFMLHQNKYKLADAYELIVVQLKAMNVINIASESAYRRVWNYVCKNYSDIVTYSREGLKAALDNKLPYLTRDKNLLDVGDVLVADGHVLDFMIKNPKDGKAQRATLIGFLDWKTWNLCGYELMFTENTQSIASALRNSIIFLGKMPKVVYIDNGRAFKNKAFGGQKLQECGVQGIYEKLGIKTAFSKPYNGRSKVIERFWEELTNSFAKLMPSYIGNTIENQPASTKRNEKYHKCIQSSYVPTISEVKSMLEIWLNNVYRKRLSENGLTIAENFANGKGNGVNVDLLDDLMMASEPRTVGRNGVKLFSDWYYAPQLTGLKTKVIARYSMFDLSYVKIYSLNNEFLCKAERLESVHPMAGLLGSPKDLAAYKQKQKEIHKIQTSRIKKSKNILGNLYGHLTTAKHDSIAVISSDDEINKYQITCYS